jgi:hypothetical protein
MFRCAEVRDALCVIGEFPRNYLAVLHGSNLPLQEYDPDGEAPHGVVKGRLYDLYVCLFHAAVLGSWLLRKKHSAGGAMHYLVSGATGLR